jgi:hypothetical protein
LAAGDGGTVNVDQRLKILECRELSSPMGDSVDPDHPTSKHMVNDGS